MVGVGGLARHPAADVPRGLRRGDRPRRARSSRAVPDLPARARPRRGAPQARGGRASRDRITAEDLYPDAVECLRALHDAGYRIGVVGNQPARAEAALRELGLPLDLLAISATWGVEKPDPRFFERIAAELGLPTAEIAYVGDRLDNDVRPAAAAGMQAIFMRRGPWAWIQAPVDDPPEAALTIEQPGGAAGVR